MFPLGQIIFVGFYLLYAGLNGIFGFFLTHFGNYVSTIETQVLKQLSLFVRLLLLCCNLDSKHTANDDYKLFLC